MNTVKARSSLEPSSLSFSRRHFNSRQKKHVDQDDEGELVLTYETSSHSFSGVLEKQDRVLVSFSSLPTATSALVDAPPRKKLPNLKSLFAKSSWSRRPSKVIGTLFGYRRGHVRIAFQEHPKSTSAFLIEISTPTGSLVKKMASGMVRVAFECEKRFVGKKGPKLLDEPLWRAYCNGNKCGPATRRECGPEELGVLAAVGPVSMGAGVLPSGDDDDVGEEGELMYMRAMFERVAGSTKDSEAFYMINPDGSGGPELSLFFLRV